MCCMVNIGLDQNQIPCLLEKTLRRGDLYKVEDRMEARVRSRFGMSSQAPRLLLDISSLFILQRRCLTHEATMASLVAAAPFMSAFERISMRRRRACAARMERYSEHLS